MIFEPKMFFRFSRLKQKYINFGVLVPPKATPIFSSVGSKITVKTVKTISS